MLGERSFLSNGSGSLSREPSGKPLDPWTLNRTKNTGQRGRRRMARDVLHHRVRGGGDTTATLLCRGACREGVRELSGFTFCGPDLGRKTAPVFGPCCFTDRPFASHDVAIRQYLRLHEVSGSLDTPSKLYTGRIGVSLNLLQKHLRVYGVSQSP